MRNIGLGVAMVVISIIVFGMATLSCPAMATSSCPAMATSSCPAMATSNGFSIEGPDVAAVVIGLIVLVTGIWFVIIVPWIPRFAPYIEYAGILLLAILFLEITIMVLPVLLPLLFSFCTLLFRRSSNSGAGMLLEELKYSVRDIVYNLKQGHLGVLE